MKFTKFGKALLMTTLSAAVVLSVSSCVQSYTVGYLYVQERLRPSQAATASSAALDIDHNTGKLNNVDGLPVSSGGSNPVRAVLVTGSRFLYVLTAASTPRRLVCTTADPCQNANITQFVVGGATASSPRRRPSYYQGHQSLPPHRRRLGKLPLRAGTRCARQQRLHRQ